MDQSDEFAASLWIVRQAARQGDGPLWSNSRWHQFHALSRQTASISKAARPAVCGRLLGIPSRFLRRPWMKPYKKYSPGLLGNNTGGDSDDEA